jgi:hypothetical protein
MSTALRHRCRNPRCRAKLTAPVENKRHAFCCHGCHAAWCVNATRASTR